jgi:hypothetical protein
MSDDLTTKPCMCGNTMKEVIHAQNKIRRGWYCTTCQKFEQSIGRERKLDSSHQLHGGNHSNASS